MIVQSYAVDLEEFKRFCENHQVINGFYLTAYLENNNPTLEPWIKK